MRTQDNAAALGAKVGQQSGKSADQKKDSHLLLLYVEAAGRVIPRARRDTLKMLLQCVVKPCFTKRLFTGPGVTMYENLIYECDGPVAVITLNRPNRRNALSL